MSIMKNSLLAIAMLIIGTSSANAGLMGSGVTANYHYATYGSILHTEISTVAAGNEWVNPTGFPGDWDAFDYIDIGDDYIHFDYKDDACCRWVNTSYNGFEFIFDSGVLADLSAVSFSANTDDYVDSMLSWVDDTLFVNWQGGNITGVDSVHINLTFASIPAPASALLLGLGLVGLSLRRRNK
ncbi:PEP-CTERM sorting domain-containing protein [Corallincola holothuriorum]|uniref:PEP-CTERM sorting domain-containing protein n=2 Tax=Corallincola holothuriorum TaxID=2282215 RepID=A0A368N6U7_9GAMM|nr:PEP-CTERM sorting domain-containing protein [Corallincola holothuriorum]